MHYSTDLQGPPPTGTSDYKGNIKMEDLKINERENKLFARWSPKYEGLFMKDGVPCSE